MLEIRRSLYVYDPRIARRLALKYSARVFQVFEMATHQSLPRERIQQLIAGAFHDLRISADRGFVPTSAYPDLEIIEQAGLAQEHLLALKADLEACSFDEALRQKVVRFADSAGIAFNTLDGSSQADLLSGYARAVREQQKLFLFRLSDRIMPYHPSDALFQERATDAEIAEATLKPKAIFEAIDAGMISGNYSDAFSRVREIIDPLREKIGGEIHNNDPGEFECHQLMKSNSERKAAIGSFFRVDNVLALLITDAARSPEALRIFQAGYAFGVASGLGIFRLIGIDHTVATATTEATEYLESRVRGGDGRADLDKPRIENRRNRVIGFVCDNPNVKSVIEIARAIFPFEEKNLSLASLTAYIRREMSDHLPGHLRRQISRQIPFG